VASIHRFDHFLDLNWLREVMSNLVTARSLKAFICGISGENEIDAASWAALRIASMTLRVGVSDDLFTITTDPSLPASVRNRFALLSLRPIDVAGYGVQLVNGDGQKDGTNVPAESTVYRLPNHFNYLKSGDIVFINSKRDFLHTLFQKESRHNLLTEQCNPALRDGGAR